MKSLIWMVGALVSFCMLAIGARELSGEIGTFQALFLRSIFGLLIISGIILSLGKRSLFSTHRLRTHAFRNVFHFIAQYGWFLGIALLPLAEVFALEFTVPFWAAIIAAIFLNERLTLKKGISICVGMLGVLVIVQPGSDIFDSNSFIVLGAAVCFAVAHTSTKSLSKTDEPLTIVFYMCLIQLPMGLVLSIGDWVMPNSNQWFWVGVISFTALSAHFCMSKALQMTEVTTVTILDFLRLPLIAVVGIIFYNEPFDSALIWGGLLMLIGNISNLYQRKPSKRNLKNAS
ncbi:DMT family transporter [Vibrio cortegadensis]|uniref:DMT family transporter n=1 Tax=Vibrio cortegadensis TaxID=1328770 RepID=A0ABV4M4K9_9VIBR